MRDNRDVSRKVEMTIFIIRNNKVNIFSWIWCGVVWGCWFPDGLEDGLFKIVDVFNGRTEDVGDSEGRAGRRISTNGAWLGFSDGCSDGSLLREPDGKSLENLDGNSLGTWDGPWVRLFDANFVGEILDVLLGKLFGRLLGGYEICVPPPTYTRS